MEPIKRFFIILSVLVFGAALFLLNRTSQEFVPQDKLNVAASFYPLAHIVAEVGGQHVSVKNILPPGAEPHDFEPSPQQFVDLGKSDLFIFNGGHFEPWISTWEKGVSTKSGRVLNMVDELARRQNGLIERGGEVDPHVWLDPVMFRQEVEIIRDVLIEIDPKNTPAYQANANQFIDSINELDQRFREGLRECVKHEAIVSHDAFGYLARRYDFSIIPIAGISPDEEPSPRDIARIADIAREKGLEYIFFETTVNPRLSETIAREVGATTLVLNPLESLTADEVQSGEDYISIMAMNLNNLQIAMSCN